MNEQAYSLDNHWSDSNRAAHYGDGVFTTMRVTGGCIQFFEYHQKRLLRDTKAIGIPTPNKELWVEAVQLAQEIKDGVLKLVLSAGVGGRGYQRPSQLAPVARFFTSELPNHYSEWQSKGIRLGISPIKLAVQPLLAGVKHLNRLEQVFIKQKMSSTRFDDVIVLNTNDCLVESSAGNLFVLNENGKWQTPQLNDSGVAGVVRQVLLDLKPSTINATDEMSLNVGINARAIMITNCLMGLVPVRELCVEGENISLDIQPVLSLREELNLV